MACTLLPRISRLTVDRILESMRRRGEGAAVADLVEDDLRHGAYGAIGGQRATGEQLAGLKSTVLEIMRDVSARHPLAAMARSEFDSRCSEYLGCLELFEGGEALRDDVWAFISTVLCRDAVKWRFQGLAPERFHGGVRNGLQRLWMRGRICDRGADHPARWELLTSLTEDAFVQIIERPSIAASRRLALAIAEEWHVCSRRHGRGSMESIMRTAIRDLRITNQVILIEALPDDELERRIALIFDQAATGRRNAA